MKKIKRLGIYTKNLTGHVSEVWAEMICVVVVVARNIKNVVLNILKLVKECILILRNGEKIIIKFMKMLLGKKV